MARVRSSRLRYPSPTWEKGVWVCGWGGRAMWISSLQERGVEVPRSPSKGVKKGARGGWGGGEGGWEKGRLCGVRQVRASWANRPSLSFAPPGPAGSPAGRRSRARPPRRSPPPPRARGRRRPPPPARAGTAPAPDPAAAPGPHRPPPRRRRAAHRSRPVVFRGEGGGGGGGGGASQGEGVGGVLLGKRREKGVRRGRKATGTNRVEDSSDAPSRLG